MLDLTLRSGDGEGLVELGSHLFFFGLALSGIPSRLLGVIFLGMGEGTNFSNFFSFLKNDTS